MSRITPIVVAVALAAALAGCSGSSGDSAAHSSDASVASDSATPTPTPTEAPASGMTPLSATVTDPDLGDSIAITGIVRKFPKPSSIVKSGEVILVQVTVTAGSKYYAGWNESQAVLVNGAGDEFNALDLDSVAGPMTTAGYTPFSVANKNGIVPTGAVGTPGWLTFIVDDTNGPLSFGTHHGAATISGGGSIAEATYKVQIAG